MLSKMVHNTTISTIKPMMLSKYHNTQYMHIKPIDLLLEISQYTIHTIKPMMKVEV